MEVTTIKSIPFLLVLLQFLVTFCQVLNFAQTLRYGSLGQDFTGP